MMIRAVEHEFSSALFVEVEQQVDMIQVGKELIDNLNSGKQGLLTQCRDDYYLPSNAKMNCVWADTNENHNSQQVSSNFTK